MGRSLPRRAGRHASAAAGTSRRAEAAAGPPGGVPRSAPAASRRRRRRRAAAASLAPARTASCCTLGGRHGVHRMAPMRFGPRSPALLRRGLAAAGCGEPGRLDPGRLPGRAGAYLTALERAPARSKLAGETPISDCLAENQQAGDLARRRRRDGREPRPGSTPKRAPNPAAPRNLQLGYLLGAAQRGADGTEGIHADLIRRLTAAARFSPDNRPLPAAFLAHLPRRLRRRPRRAASVGPPLARGDDRPGGRRRGGRRCRPAGRGRAPAGRRSAAAGRGPWPRSRGARRSILPLWG